MFLILLDFCLDIWIFYFRFFFIIFWNKVTFGFFYFRFCQFFLKYEIIFLNKAEIDFCP